MSEFTTIENQAGELDVVPQHDKPQVEPKLNAEFFLKTEFNVDQSVDAVLKNGYTREVLYVTFDRVARDADGNIKEIVPYGFTYQATAEHIERWPDEYKAFQDRLAAKKENERLARILVNKRKVEAEEEQVMSKSHMPTLDKLNRPYDAQTEAINARMRR